MAHIQALLYTGTAQSTNAAFTRGQQPAHVALKSASCCHCHILPGGANVHGEIILHSKLVKWSFMMTMMIDIVAIHIEKVSIPWFQLFTLITFHFVFWLIDLRYVGVTWFIFHVLQLTSTN